MTPREQKAYDAARRRIELCRRRREKSLVFSHMGLTALPPEIGQLTALSVLDLLGNQLTALPPEIGQLPALSWLYLGGNHLTALPPEIGQLPALAGLDLLGNHLTTLPPEIGQLPALMRLNLSDNPLTALPPEIGQLPALSRLDLRNNRLTALPPEIGQLPALTWLDLSGNELTALPPEIGRLRRLERLAVEDNALETLPEELRGLTELQELTLHGNSALGLPAEVLGPRWADSNDTDNPPAPPREILDYYFAVGRGARRLNEAKVIFVGRGGAGKTTLRKQLMQQRIPAKERRTKGIDLKRWELDVDGQTLGLNLWDFGGQEVMYSTHQFFLTERAVYILVLDARAGRQDDNVDYWLRLVEELGKGSPVILVLNHIDENEGLELDDVGWREKFPFISGSVLTCAKKGKGMDKLIAALRTALREKLPEARKEFPSEWWAVKEALTEMREKLKQDYITEKQYLELCRKSKVQASDCQTLLHRVRDLGLVSYFPELSALGLPPVLRPGWLTGGLYSLIDNPKLKKQGGVVKACEVYGWLREPERYERQHGLLFLKVAEHFRLGFAVAGRREEYMLTALLPEKTPKLPHWQKEENELRLELHYTKVLPEGLLAQFIALAHAHNGKGARWRNGVELALDGATALVTADVPAKRITIRVRGQGRAPRDLMTVIRTHFRTLSARLTPPRELVPLKGYDAEPLDYAHLLALENAGQTHAQVTDRKGELHLIPVQPLLDLYEDRQTREAQRFNQLEKMIRQEGSETRGAVKKDGAKTRRHVSAEVSRLRNALRAIAQGQEADSQTLRAVQEAVLRGEIKQAEVLQAVAEGFRKLEAEVLAQAKKVTKNLTHPGQVKPWRFDARPKTGGLQLTSQTWQFILIDEHTHQPVQPLVAGQEILEFTVPRVGYAALVKWSKRVTALGFLACGVAGASAGEGLELNPSPESNAQDLADLMEQSATLASTLDASVDNATGVEAVEFFQTKVLPANPGWEQVVTKVARPEGGWKWVGPSSRHHYE